MPKRCVKIEIEKNSLYKKHESETLIMKLGAQFYSIRTQTTTPEDLLESMRKIKAIGYDVMQASGICKIEGERLKSFIDETNLPITCTHTAFSEIVENTDECIKFHKTINCPVIGLGAMAAEYRETYEGLKKFKEMMSEPVKDIYAIVPAPSAVVRKMPSKLNIP